MDIAGEELIWPSGKIIISPNSLSGVKEVITFNQDTMHKVMKSGYRNKIHLVDSENKTTITIDIASIENFQKEQKKKAREKYYEQFLIPSGGTTDWLKICKDNHYLGCGYTGHTVCEIPISNDSRIAVTDHTQPKGDIYNYNKDEDEFFTSLTFYKKELDNNSIYAPSVYERAYNIYFPFGARFDEEILSQIGTALSGLIDKARDLPNNPRNKEILEDIESHEKLLLKLILDGTKNKDAVKEIMKDISIPKPSTKIKEARYPKDFLPCFTTPLNNTQKNQQEDLLK